MDLLALDTLKAENPLSLWAMLDKVDVSTSIKFSHYHTSTNSNYKRPRTWFAVTAFLESVPPTLPLRLCLFRPKVFSIRHLVLEERHNAQNGLLINCHCHRLHECWKIASPFPHELARSERAVFVLLCAGKMN